MEKSYYYPKISNAFLLVCLMFVFQILFFGILSIIFGDINNHSTNYYMSFINSISFALVIVIGYNKTGESFKQIFPIKFVQIKLYIPIIITCLGLSIILSEIDNILRMILPMPDVLFNMFMEMYASKDIIGSVLLLVIVAPITEEYFFRGLILNGFLKNYDIKKAAIASSILFGFAHLNPWQFISAFIMGIYLVWIYIKTKSLIPCLLVHGVLNGLPLIIIHLTSLKIVGYTEVTKTTVFQPLWFDMLGIILIAAGLYVSHMFFTNINRREHRGE